MWRTERNTNFNYFNVIMQRTHPIFICVSVYFQQNNLFKSREEKYQSRIRLLETLATGTSEETQVQNMSYLFQHFVVLTFFFFISNVYSNKHSHLPEEILLFVDDHESTQEHEGIITFSF